MAEQFADLVEGNALPEQVGGQRVTEQMRSFPSRIDASAYQRSPDDCGNGDGVREATNGSINVEGKPCDRYSAAGRSADRARWPHRRRPATATVPNVRPCTGL